MKDIDFDELDKAVNSLMDPNAKGTTSNDQTATTVPTNEPQPLVIPEKKSMDTSASTMPVKTETEVKPSTVGSPKKSGRFMDVVHPSSDMRTSAPIKVAPRESAPRPSAAPVVNEEGKTVTDEKKAGNFSFPDPLSAVPGSPAEPTHDEAQLPTDNDDNKDALAKTFEPSESLFLPDVKVEKRPLGMSVEMTDDSDESTISDDNKKVDTLVTPDPTLAELGDDVLAIEADAGAAGEGLNVPASSDMTAEASGTGSDSTSGALATAAISSIPRQYTVKPSSDDKHHEALYDSAAQTGTPLQHPEKKKSGWMVILWVVLLIVVGVGAALALYFLRVF